LAVKGREVPRRDWPTNVAVVRKIFGNNLLLVKF
jgi:hypothetical protein